MKNEFVKTEVNFIAILEALEQASRHAWETHGKGSCGISGGAWAVAEYKTIGFSVGRQCGATRAVLKWMKKHITECLYITKDIRAKDFVKELYVGRENGFLDDYFRGVPTLNKDNLISIEGYDELTETVRSMIKYIIVDDASLTFNMSYLKRREFNQWVADNFGEDTFVILIK